MVFDTSLIHDAINDSDKMRYILMLRLWHPDLTPVEQEALQFTYDCLDVPELLSDNPELRRQAEEQVAQWRKFPELPKMKASKQGFGGARRAATATTSSSSKKKKGRK